MAPGYSACRNAFYVCLNRGCNVVHLCLKASGPRIKGGSDCEISTKGGFKSERLTAEYVNFAEGAEIIVRLLADVRRYFLGRTVQLPATLIDIEIRNSEVQKVRHA